MPSDAMIGEGQVGEGRKALHMTGEAVRFAGALAAGSRSGFRCVASQALRRVERAVIAASVLVGIVAGGAGETLAPQKALTHQKADGLGAAVDGGIGLGGVPVVPLLPRARAL